MHYKVSDTFKNRYTELIKGLESGLLLNKEAMNDLKRLQKYHKESLNCQIINKDRDFVIEKINEVEGL